MELGCREGEKEQEAKILLLLVKEKAESYKQGEGGHFFFSEWGLRLCHSRGLFVVSLLKPTVVLKVVLADLCNLNFFIL